MRFAINAATEVQIFGEQRVRAWVNNCFSNEPMPSLQLHEVLLG